MATIKRFVLAAGLGLLLLLLGCEDMLTVPIKVDYRTGKDDLVIRLGSGGATLPDGDCDFDLAEFDLPENVDIPEFDLGDVDMGEIEIPVFDISCLTGGESAKDRCCRKDSALTFDLTPTLFPISFADSSKGGISNISKYQKHVKDIFIRSASFNLLENEPADGDADGPATTPIAIRGDIPRFSIWISPKLSTSSTCTAPEKCFNWNGGIDGYKIDEQLVSGLQTANYQGLCTLVETCRGVADVYKGDQSARLVHLGETLMIPCSTVDGDAEAGEAAPRPDDFLLNSSCYSGDYQEVAKDFPLAEKPLQIDEGNYEAISEVLKTFSFEVLVVPCGPARVYPLDQALLLNDLCQTASGTPLPELRLQLRLVTVIEAKLK